VVWQGAVAGAVNVGLIMVHIFLQAAAASASAAAASAAAAGLCRASRYGTNSQCISLVRHKQVVWQGAVAGAIYVGFIVMHVLLCEGGLREEGQ
jgi:hypothetical protein